VLLEIEIPGETSIHPDSTQKAFFLRLQEQVAQNPESGGQDKAQR
jgi:hypothetical protein